MVEMSSLYVFPKRVKKEIAFIYGIESTDNTLLFPFDMPLFLLIESKILDHQNNIETLRLHHTVLIELYLS